jgi:hypothetical protein
MLLFVLLAAIQATAPGGQAASDPFAPLAVSGGPWTVKAEHPWGGPPGTQDHLASHCGRFNSYFTCEQTVNGKPQGLLIYTAATFSRKLHSVPLLQTAWLADAATSSLTATIGPILTSLLYH